MTFGSAVTVSRLEFNAKKLDIKASPRQLFAKFQDEFNHAFLLESAKGESRLAEYSFMGFSPRLLVTVKNHAFEFQDTKTEERTKKRVSDPLLELKKIISTNTREGPFRFIGGAVGYISYDAVRYWEQLPHFTKDDLLLPDLEFGIFNDGIVFDHYTGEKYYYWLDENRLESVLQVAKSESNEYRMTVTTPRTGIQKEKFESMVRQAKEYIRLGDIFQVVLSKRYEFELQGNLIRFYSELSKINPSPYMYFLKFGKRSIVGSSPEMLARSENDVIETFPIAGTRPRLSDAKKNAKLTQELLADPKERAEHVMLVDLARNDIGKVAKFGTVRVPELITVQQFSHVQHIVSHVVGDLKDGSDSFDVLKAVFPAGTVSGAPKPRAMEIIEELEPVRRGPYAGAVGYFSFNGKADFAITIRTLVADSKRCFIQTGAGIVADSSPQREWQETESKATALLRAIELAQGEKR
jgi:anthranilate synthase component 1